MNSMKTTTECYDDIHIASTKFIKIVFSQMNNQLVLQEAGEIQRRTKDSLQHIQQLLAETAAIGSLTLAALDEQSSHMERISKETLRLNENLNKATKLQNRFAAWSFSIGSRRQARKMARTERNEERLSRKIDQNEVTRNNLISIGGMCTNNDAWFQKEDALSREKEERRRLVELFGDSCFSQRDLLREGPIAGETYGGTPLSDGENIWLCNIEADDASIDCGLDDIGRQVEGLLSLASSMGKQAMNQQGTKLDHITHQLEKANEKQQVIGHRARLFTINRKEKRKDRFL